ncbi:MAG: hypothetical protein OQK27_02575, partial [Gammaproteobacteria bacterium]|nr:hypothetical protein [Gammaproteobacteria bacterium]
MNHRKTNPFRPGPLTAAMALALATGPVLAQASDDTSRANATPRSETSLNRILVTASPEQAAETAGSVQVIDAETLEQHAYSDVNRVLRQVPGLNIV